MDALKPSNQPCRFLLVDGHAYAYRAFHAIRELSGPEGEPVNAIFGFVKMLQKLRDKLTPTHLLVVWDAGLDPERTAALPEYKAQRPSTPADLAAQLPQIGEFLDASGVSSLAVDGLEADDLIATYALAGVSLGCDVIIASSDKDFMQLVRPGIRLFNPGDKSERLWSDAEVIEKVGVRPDQVVDYLSMVGDSVDNIDGVPGIGPKTASDLLNTYDSINNLLVRLAAIPSPRIRAAVDTRRAILSRNRKLISLRTDLEMPVPLENCILGDANNEKLSGLYFRWGFRSLRNEIEARTANHPVLL